MKKNLLLMMLCMPIVLSAQNGNGVTVSNLAVNAGTVTFNVSWKNTGMPTLWSDTVWVFVDYNKNGVMERLPLSAGATLTATSPGGKVIEEPGNNKGVWVAGNARTNSSFSATVQLLTSVSNVGGACVYGSNYPPVAKYNIAVENISISFTGTPPYDLVLNTSSGTTSAQAYSTYNLFAGQTVQSFTDKTGAPGIIIPGYNQPQGSCTFTQPPVVGTFATFPSNYSASTYVTLTDERDNKNYEVVKIGGRWVMARNLNYQKGLTWRARADQPFTTTTNGVPGIGNFWCPGGNTTSVTTSTRESCDVWGALYTWEAAMSFDGLGSWSSDAITTYCTGTVNSANCQKNWGRSGPSSSSGGRGICPPNWHVPTGYEWGVLFDAMESDGGDAHATAAVVYSLKGIDAGLRAKSKCVAPSPSNNGEDYVNDESACWAQSMPGGEDTFAFRWLPSGDRHCSGHVFEAQGWAGWQWTSSAFGPYDATRYRVDGSKQIGDGSHCARAQGNPARCIRNL